MSIFSRITATVVAGVDKTVSQIENHDAIIDATIKDSRKTLARARVRLQRVQRDGANIRSKISEGEKQIETWTQRARDAKEDDHDLAMACMQRRKACISELEKNRAALQRHEGVEAQVSKTISALQRRIQEITEQRNQLRTRESAAEAQRIVNKLDCNDVAGIEDTFDRWDSMVSEAEIMQGGFVSEPIEDTLEARFSNAEEEASLKAELDALVTSDNNNSKNGE